MSNRRRLLTGFFVCGALWTKDTFSGLLKAGFGSPGAMRVAATARGESDINEDGSFAEHVGGAASSPGDADLIPFVHERQISYVVNAVYADSINRRSVVPNYESLRRYTGQVDMLHVLSATTDAMTGGIGISSVTTPIRHPKTMEASCLSLKTERAGKGDSMAQCRRNGGGP